MNTILWNAGIYISLGIFTLIIMIKKEPLIIALEWGLILLIPFVIITFPYWLFVSIFYHTNTGRWIRDAFTLKI